tara:strand:- start:907 stop:1320 length:414 start_codon:yes stop_codon:yes gene_type:complete
MAKLLGNIEQGGLHLDKAWETLDALRELDGKRVEISVKEWKNTRRNRANRFYWGVVIPSVFKAFADVGIKLVNHEQAHEAVRLKFLSVEVETKEGSFRVPQSTTTMKVDEFANYIFVIIEYLRDYYNYNVPLPEDKF